MNALDELRRYASALEMPEPEATGPIEVRIEDQGIAKAIRDLKFPAGNDYGKALAAIAIALSKLELKAEAPEVEVKIDLAPLVAATEANTLAIQQMTAALKRERKLVFKDGQPVGIK